MNSKVDPLARYLKTHEWARAAHDHPGEFYVGISDHAQDAMSDLVYAEVPRVGARLKAGEALGVVESVKAASDVYMPVAGTITATNPAVESTPELINQDPFGAGWLIRFKPDHADELDALMDAAAYSVLLSQTAHHG